ncbi:MAG TPA: methyltransferase [Clostridiales bacterium]|nr:methyltransferase [Clostridiales bacterium]
MPGGFSEFETVLRLVFSLLLGAVVGLERETHDRPAGLRTFILVSVGSTLIMIVSMNIRYLFPGGVGVDPGRIAAQVVTGIGFLGAGTILHEGPSIRGLTTAAGLWVVAAVGLAVGAGFYLAAGVTTALALVTLSLLSHVERSYIGGKGDAVVTIVTVDRPGQLGRIGSALGDNGINIKDIKLSPTEEDLVEVVLKVKVPSREALAKALQALAGLTGVRSAEYST